jgi:hypothetical protein
MTSTSVVRDSELPSHAYKLMLQWPAFTDMSEVTDFLNQQSELMDIINTNPTFSAETIPNQSQPPIAYDTTFQLSTGVEASIEATNMDYTASTFMPLVGTKHTGIP